MSRLSLSLVAAVALAGCVRLLDSERSVRVADAGADGPLADATGDVLLVDGAADGSSPLPDGPVDGAAPDHLLSDASGPFATWNDGDKQKNIVLSADGLAASVPSTVDSVNDSVRATIGLTSGRWYWEVQIVTRGASNYHSIGVATRQMSLEVSPESDGHGGCAYRVAGGLQCADGSTDPATGYQTGSVISVALDLEGSPRVYFALDGQWLGGADPANGSGGLPLPPPGAEQYYPVGNISSGDEVRANFGGEPFRHPVPSSFAPGVY